MRCGSALVSLLTLALPAGCHSKPDDSVAPITTPPEEPETQAEIDCNAMCDSAIELGCEDPTCALRCVDSIETAGDCQTATHDYVACLGREGLSTCYDVPPACDDAYLAWKGCVGGLEGGCGPVRCDNPDGAACQCEATCGDGKVFQETCFESANGYDCQCTVDGETAVVCNNSQIACAFFIGCCSIELQNM